MEPVDCFEAAAASKEKIKFVGLQYGGQCWGGKTFGKYGKADDDKNECDMVCNEDPEVVCGGSWRNSIYDLSTFVSQKTGDCTADPVDCSQKGGYDTSDKCQQTCKDDTKLAKCEEKCFADPNAMVRDTLRKCLGDCRGAKHTCPSSFVDCS